MKKVSTFLLGLLLGFVCLGSMSFVTATYPGGYLDAHNYDYWWMINVTKGDLVLLQIQASTIYDWESCIFFSNLTTYNCTLAEDTHVYQFFAPRNDDYLLRLGPPGVSESFSYTIKNETHIVSKQPMYSWSGELSAHEIDYHWLPNVKEGDLILLIIKASTIYKWESRIYDCDLGIVEDEYREDTHVYQFFAPRNDDYLLRLGPPGVSESFSYIIEWNFVPGNINRDGKLDHKDLLLFAKAYGSKCGELDYNEDADLNCDCSVDHKDLLILAAHYGGKLDP